MLYDPECAAQDGDSGFTVLWDDAPDASDLRVGDLGTFDDPRVTSWCVHCLLDEHPEVGRGLDIAKRHGESYFDVDGERWLIVDGDELLIPDDSGHRPGSPNTTNGSPLGFAAEARGSKPNARLTVRGI